MSTCPWRSNVSSTILHAVSDNVVSSESSGSNASSTSFNGQVSDDRLSMLRWEASVRRQTHVKCGIEIPSWELDSHDLELHFMPRSHPMPRYLVVARIKCQGREALGTPPLSPLGVPCQVPREHLALPPLCSSVTLSASASSIAALATCKSGTKDSTFATAVAAMAMPSTSTAACAWLYGPLVPSVRARSMQARSMQSRSRLRSPSTLVVSLWPDGDGGSRLCWNSEDGRAVRRRRLLLHELVISVLVMCGWLF